ncbi:MAG: hypothetical protein M0P31_17295 [Solirubrobacteraceae bacterium]|nr:hypothetical protein [Solirubrobacteraceae bacterium]
MAGPAIFPYPTLAEAPILRLDQPEVDGEPAPLLNRDGVVDLSGLQGRWSTVRLQVVAEVPTDEIRLLPADEPEVVLTVHCAPTNLRTTTRLVRSADNEHAWEGTVELTRRTLRDQASLYATVDDVANRWIGRTHPVAVHLRPPRDPRISGGHFPVKWRDFTVAAPGETPIPSRLKDEMSWVDVANVDGPIIYLNERVSGLRELLDDRTGRTRVERAARDTVLDLVATPAMVALLNAALSSVARSDADDPVQWPTETWQRDLLEAMLPRMYPDVSDSDAALAAATTPPLDHRDAGDLQSRVLSASHEFTRASAHAKTLARAFDYQGVDGL